MDEIIEAKGEIFFMPLINIKYFWRGTLQVEGGGGVIWHESAAQ